MKISGGTLTYCSNDGQFSLYTTMVTNFVLKAVKLSNWVYKLQKRNENEMKYKKALKHTRSARIVVKNFPINLV